MKYKSRLDKLEKVLGTPEDRVICAELLDNGNYLLKDNQEITKEQLDNMKGKKLILVWE